MLKHNFVNRSYRNPTDYLPRTDAPALVGEEARGVCRYNLFEMGAPAHTKNYMVGLDVLGWQDGDNERSQLIVDQKAGSLVLPWEASNEGGIWLFLQETFRAPHSKDERSVKQLLAEGAFDALGVWSLEAPAGGIKHVDGVPVEAPVDAAVRELAEETGMVFDADNLVNLLPGGLHIGGDINTKVSHLFAGDVAKGAHDASKVAIEADEAIGNLLAFHAADRKDLMDLLEHTRRCAGTSAAIGFLALQPEVGRHLS